MNRIFVEKKIREFLADDLGDVDVLNVGRERVLAHISAQQEGVLCGGRFVRDVFESLATERDDFTLRHHMAEGTRFVAGDRLVSFTVHPETLRHGIRTALNLVGHLSGIATHTARLQAELEGTGCRLMDTRKLRPGLGAFEKYAVRVGGGRNHRHGRYDGVMLKREDIVIDGGIAQAIDRALRTTAHLTSIEVEVDSIDQLQLVIADGRVRHVLLDNMSTTKVRDCVQLAGDDIVLEASGITPDQFRPYAETGVPYISTSALVLGAPHCKVHLVMR